MKDQLAALYGLQEVDVRIGKANSALAALTGAKALKQRLALAETAVQEAEKAQSDIESELKDSELKLQSIDDKRAKFEKRLYSGTVASPKELSSIEKEIDILKKQQGELDGRVLELYDEVEQAREKAKAAREKQQVYEKQVAEALETESSEKSKLESELADLDQQREAAVEKVTDPSLLSRYETIAKKTKSGGVARVRDGKCEGCNISVTIFVMRKLLEGKESQYCENCGRILFLDANSDTDSDSDSDSESETDGE